MSKENATARMLPKNTQAIVYTLLNEHNMTAKEIAKKIGVSARTVFRINEGAQPSRKTELNLIRLFCRLVYKNVQTA